MPAVANRATQTGHSDDHALLAEVTEALRRGDVARLEGLVDLEAADRAWLNCDRAASDERALHDAQVAARTADERDQARKAIAFARTHTISQGESPLGDSQGPEHSWDKPLRIGEPLASECVVIAIPALYQHRLWVHDGASPEEGESIFVDTVRIDNRSYIARIRPSQYRPTDAREWPLPFGAPFRIETISRTTGYVGGGTLVQIVGSGFVSGGDRKLRVLFGTQPGTIVTMEDWRMFVRVPARSTSDDVAVTVVAEPGGQVVVAKNFGYLHDVHGVPPACAAVEELRARVRGCPISVGDRAHLREMLDNEIRMWNGKPEDPDCDRTLEVAQSLCNPPPEDPDETESSEREAP